MLFIFIFILLTAFLEQFDPDWIGVLARPRWVVETDREKDIVLSHLNVGVLAQNVPHGASAEVGNLIAGQGS